jgi:hypothetical protein
MARPKTDSPDANASDKSDGTERTAALANEPMAPISAEPPVPGADVNRDPESDTAKAAEADRTARLLPAEDQTDAGTGQPAEAAPAGTDPSVSERVKVKTSGPFMLQDPYSLDTMTEADDGPSATKGVVRTAFVIDRLSAGQLIEL